MAQLQFGDQDARRALADADHDYVSLGDMSFKPPPPSVGGQPPIPVHHPVSDPPSAGKFSPAVSTRPEPFEVKPESVGEIYPPARGYGNYEGKEDEAARAVPLSGYGGQPDEVSLPKDEGYTSFGMGESQDSETLGGVLSEEGDNSVKQRESSAPRESLAKELEDHFVGGGGVAAGTGPPLKREIPDLPKGDTDEVRKTEVAPPELLGDVKQQEENREAARERSYDDGLQDHEEAGSLSTGAPGSSKDKPVDVEGVPLHAAMAKEPEEGGSFATGSRGIIDVQDPKGSNIDLSETSPQEPNVVEDVAEGDSKDYMSKADDSGGIEAGHADTSHFTSQIKSPVDDPKQRYAVDAPIEETSVDGTKQEFLRPDSSEQEHLIELPQEPYGSRKEEVSLSEPKPERSVDLQQGDSLDEARETDVAPPELLGDAKQQQENREAARGGSNDDGLQDHEGAGGPSTGAPGSSKDESVDVEGVPQHAAKAEEPESGSFATGFRGIFDVLNPKAHLPEASPQEPNVGDDAAEGDSKDMSKADDSSGIEAGHADTSHFTSQIKSPVDDPKQRYAVDAPIQEISVDGGKQEFLRPDSSEQEHVSELPQEPQAYDFRKEEVSLSEPQPERSVDLQQGDPLDEARETEVAPPELLGGAKQQEENREAAREGSYDDGLQDHEEAGSLSTGAPGSIEDKPVDVEGVPQHAAMAEEPEGGSFATGFGGILDVLNPKGYLPEASPQEPNVGDDAAEGDSKDTSKADDFSGIETGHADTSHFTSQIKSPVDDPIQVDAPIQERSVDGGKQEFLRPDSSEQEHVSELPQEPRAYDFRKEEVSLSEPKPERSVDLQQGDSVDEARETEVAPSELLGGAKQQQENREAAREGSYDDGLQDHEKAGSLSTGAPGSIEDKSVDVEGVPQHAAVSEEPEGGSFATESRGIMDVQDPKGSNVDLSEASPQEPNVGDDAAEGDSKDMSKRYAVDAPMEETAVDGTKQGFLRPGSSEQEHFSELPQEPRAYDSRKEEFSLSEPKPECSVDIQQGAPLDDVNQEDSLDDVKKFPVNPVEEVSNASPIHVTDRPGKMEATPQVGLLGSVEQEESQNDGDSQRSIENSQEQGEREVIPVGDFETSKDEQTERESAVPDQSAFAAEGPECSSVAAPRGGIDVQSSKEKNADFSEASSKELDAANNPVVANIADELTPRQSAIAAEEPEDISAPVSRGVNDVDLCEAGAKEPNLVEDSLEDNLANQPPSHQSAIPQVPEGESAQRARGIVDVQSLKEDYVDLSEADTKERIPTDDSMEGSITNDLTPRQPVTAEEQVGKSATESNVKSSKDDFVDVSEYNEEQPNVSDQAVGDNSLAGMPGQPDGGSAEGSRGIIDVQSLKEDYVDLSEAAPRERNSTDDAMEATPYDARVDSSFTDPKQRTSVDDSGHVKCNADGPISASSLDDADEVQGSVVKNSEVDNREPELDKVVKPEQSKQPQTTDRDMIDSERDPTDDGKEKIKAEGYSVYPDEPESKDLDGVIAAGVEYGKPAHESEADVVAELLEKPSAKAGEQTEMRGNLEEARGVVSEFESQQCEQARDSATSEEHEQQHAGNVSSALKPEGQYKSDVEDVDTENASLGDNATNVPAEEVAREFSAAETEHKDVAGSVKPEVVYIDAEQSQQAQPPPVEDDEHFQGADGKEKIKAEGFNIYSGEPESKVYNAVDIIGDKDENRAHKTEAAIAGKPRADSSGALPEAVESREYVPDNSSNMDGSGQAGEFDTNEEHRDEYVDVNVAAVEEDEGWKLDDRDDNIDDVREMEESRKDVFADKKALQYPAADFEEKKVPKGDVRAELGTGDGKEVKEAETYPTDDVTGGSEHFQGDDGRDKISAEGYNIYSGKPEKTVYDTADVIGEQHEKLPHDAEDVAANVALKPCEDGERNDKSVAGVGDMEDDALGKDSGFGSQGEELIRNVNPSSVHDENVAPPLAQHGSPIVEQGAGSQPDIRGSVQEDVAADKTDDYVKVGYGAEKSTPAQTEDIDRQLRAPSDRVGQQEERRSTDEHPLDKPYHVDNVGKPHDLGNVAEQEEVSRVEVPKRPVSLPHPQREDMVGAGINKNGGDVVNDEQQHHEAGTHKKGIFAKIKEKLTPTFASHGSSPPTQ